jgi:hypothetical protein
MAQIADSAITPGGATMDRIIRRTTTMKTVSIMPARSSAAILSYCHAPS